MSRARRSKGGRRRRSKRRRRNPWTRAHKVAVLLGVAGTAAAVFAIHQTLELRRRQIASETINYNYVPHLETWPHMDRYPNENAFGIQLLSWGYDPGPIHTNAEWTIIDARPIDAVREFQQDFNLVRTIDLPEGVPPAPPELVEDGLIGNSTALAFWTAEQWAAAMNLTWRQLVDLAWAEYEDGMMPS